MNNLPINKALIIAGHIAFLVLLYFSYHFYIERILFFDNPFYLFKIIDFEKINIEADRYGAFISQIPVLLGLKAGLPLKYLMMIYSASFILLFYLIFIICVHLLKNLAAGLTVVFILILCLKQGFFHITQECHQGLVYSALLFGIVQFNFRKNFQLLKYILGSLVIILCFYTHPITLFVILFILIYHLIDRSEWNDVGIYILLILPFIQIAFKLIFTKVSSYEQGFLTVFRTTPLSGFFSYYSTHFFLKRLFSLYFWMTILGIVTFFILLLKKEYLKAGYIFLSAIGFLVIVLVTYNKGDSDVMMERGFLPLTVFISLPFFHELFDKQEKYLLPVFLLCLVIIFAGVRRIYSEGNNFRSRVAYFNTLMEKSKNYEGGKFLIKNSEENIANIICPWPLPFTTIILSSMQDKNATRTLFLYDDIKKYEKYINNSTHTFLGADFWLEWNSKDLNHNYFNIPDGPYVVLQ